MAETYTAYLLRIWRVGEGSTSSWRAMLEDPRTHETIGFTSIEALMAFLQEHPAGKKPGDLDELERISGTQVH